MQQPSRAKPGNPASIKIFKFLFENQDNKTQKAMPDIINM